MKACCCCLFFLFFLHLASGLFPDEYTFSTWAGKIGEKLQLKSNAATKYIAIQEEYRRYDPSKVKFDRTDCPNLVSKAAVAIGDKLKNKLAALKKSVAFAEQLAENFIPDKKIKKEDIWFVNAKEISANDDDYIYNEKFKEKVNFNHSAVHIPLEIWEEDEKILNGLKWSSQIDEVFNKNLEEDESIMWQYFGSQSGFMRTFPASKWEVPAGEPADMFDVRRRPWYIQGSTSPKNVLLLIDTSGSTHGQTLELIKVTTKSILDTLGENDYVNAMWFNQYHNFTSCFRDTFVQASKRNKQVISDGVDELVSQNMADYSQGFEAAFQLFEKFRIEEAESMRGSKCNEVIMLLTDGGMDYAKDVFEKYNKDKGVRVFSFAVGPAATPISGPKVIACSNRGYFTKIPSMGSIRSNVQVFVPILARPMILPNAKYPQWTGAYLSWQGLEYTVVLSRPMVLSKKKNSQWTNAYLDALNMGMITTVMLPVYNISTKGDNQTLLGVMGLDVPTSEMTEEIPQRILGANGYGFAINNNGFVLFHPRLRGQMGYLSDPPNLDYLELEIPSPKNIQMRKNMIDKKTGHTRYETKVVSPDEFHVSEQEYTYCYHPIPHADFSLGLVVPKQSDYYVTVMNYDTSKGLPLLDNIILAPWKYCTGYDVILKGNDSTEALSNLLINSAPCDEDLVQNLMWDLSVTKFADKLCHIRRNTDEVLGSFVATNGGLTRACPSSFVSELEDDSDVHKANYYLRAAVADTFLYLTDWSEVGWSNSSRDDAPTLTVVKSVNIVLPSDHKFISAVVGAKVSSGFVEDVLNKVTECDDIDVDCYLLDDGGFIIASNGFDDLAGVFIGKQDPSLLLEMVNKSVYQTQEEYDFQAVCKKGYPLVNAGLMSLNVPRFDASHLQWWASQVFTTTMNFNLYAAVTGWLRQVFATEGVEQVEMEYPPGEEESCIQLDTQYYFGENSAEYSGQVNCTGALRSYRAMRIMDSNLLFVVAQVQSGCNCEDDPISILPKRVEGPDKCSAPARYRRRPDGCYSWHPQEDATMCGGSSAVQAPVAVVLLLIVTVVTFGIG